MEPRFVKNARRRRQRLPKRKTNKPLPTMNNPQQTEAAKQNFARQLFSDPRLNAYAVLDGAANPEMKEKVLARLEAPAIKPKRFRASDHLMNFLQAL